MKKILAMVLAISFLIVPIHAQPVSNKDMFPDISDHWAKESINKLAKLEIVSGFTDGTYKPNNKVTKCEAASIIYRMLDKEKLIKESPAELKEIQEKYEDTLTMAGIPNWAKDSISYLLEKQILTEKEIKTFVKNNQHQSISREEVCLYLGRAINKNLKITIDKEMNDKLDKFKDKNDIKEENRTYVALLLDKKIVSGTINLKEEPVFLPKGEIIRASFAVLIDSSMNVLKEYKNQNTVSIKAKIKEKYEDDKRIVFIYENGGIRDERIKDNVIILLDGEKASFGDLREGMNTELILEKNIIIKINAEKIKISKLNLGIISKIDKSKELIEYKDSNDKIHTIKLNKTVPIYLDSELSDFTKIKVGQELSEEYANGKLSKIKLKSKYKYYNGIIKEIDLNNSKITATIGENDYRFKINSECDIRRNGSVSILSQLKVGNKITVKTEYGKTVFVKTHPTMKNGTITELSVDAEKNTNYIKVSFIDDNNELYEVSDSVEIIINGKKANDVFELKVKNFVNLTFDGTNLVKIEALENSDKVGRMAYIRSIDTVDKFAEAQALETFYNLDSFSYELDLSKAIVINQQGNKSNVRYIKEWQKVFFYGEKLDFDGETTYFQVDKIMILE